MSGEGNIIPFPSTPISQSEVPAASVEAVLALRAGNSMIEKTKEALEAINRIDDGQTRRECLVRLRSIVKETIMIQILIASSMGAMDDVLSRMRADLERLDHSPV